ncbi:MAG: AAA family ATPase [Zoogloeaceae bacterium]|jgi:predicted kinase|nr:AAA family ATPase [Zoogloeaceae bacterium]
MTTLHIFPGLPGVGKTTLARHLAEVSGAAYVRIDTIEQALRDLFAHEELEDEGYRLAASRRIICAWASLWWPMPAT